MKNKLTTSAKAAKAVYDVGSEIYHLEAMRLENGDDKVIIKLADQYKKKEHLSPADAHIRAGKFIKDVDAMKAGEFGFQAVRDELAKRSKEPGDRPDDSFNLIPV